MTALGTTSDIASTHYDIDKLNKEAVDCFNDLDLCSSLSKANEAYELSLERNYTLGKVKALLSIGLYHIMKHQNRQARDVLLQALELSRVFSDRDLLNLLYSRLGMTYSQMRLFEQSIVFFNHALDMSKSLNDKKMMCGDYHNLATAYMRDENYTQAKEHFIYAIECSRQFNDDLEIAAIYTNISELYIIQKDYNLALQYCIDALNLLKGHKEVRNTIHLYYNISLCYIQLSDLEKAEEYLYKCLKLCIDHDYQPLIICSEMRLAEIKIQKKMYAAAKNLLISLEQNPALKDDVEAIRNLYNTYIRLYEVTEDYQKAFEKQKELLELEKKISDDTLKEELALQQLKHKISEEDKNLNI